MAVEDLQVVDTPVTVDPKTAEDRGDNFVPNDDPVTLDNNGDSINPNDGAAAGDQPGDKPADTPAAAPAAAPAAKPPAAPAPPADANPEDDEPGTAANGSIPKARFNEVNEARKTAQARADELARENERLRQEAAARNAPPPPPPAPAFDVEAKEQAYLEAVLDGDSGKAVKIRQEINAHLTTEATNAALTTFRKQSNAELLQEASDQAIKDHPWLNTPDGEVALNVIVAERDRRIAAGTPHHVALRESVALLAPKFAPASAPAAADPPSSASTKATPPADTRTANAVRRGAADSEAQPPNPSAGIGNRAAQAKVDVKTMTEAQFAALPEDEKKRLRGD